MTGAEDRYGAAGATAILSQVRFLGSDESHPQTAKVRTRAADESLSAALQKPQRKEWRSKIRNEIINKRKILEVYAKRLGTNVQKNSSLEYHIDEYSRKSDDCQKLIEVYYNQVSNEPILLFVRFRRLIVQMIITSLEPGFNNSLIFLGI